MIFNITLIISVIVINGAVVAVYWKIVSIKLQFVQYISNSTSIIGTVYK
jgi:hypothetical protein